eukprot:TRINITY_DN9097_c0_g1_i1.p1 TRINITY_DN9097_c0_g1~~TRINITY_DN9097_c0_g1_i1.p1  ORF type:complete len:100 (+),score=5.85 TRINITY_DN9097_c0_g1_i1:371-670(+)
MPTKSNFLIASVSDMKSVSKKKKRKAKMKRRCANWIFSLIIDSITRYPSFMRNRALLPLLISSICLFSHLYFCWTTRMDRIQPLKSGGILGGKKIFKKK